MSRNVAIVGVGAVKCDFYRDRADYDLLAEAFKKAVDDSRVTKKDIEGCAFVPIRYFFNQIIFGSTFAQGYLEMGLKSVGEYYSAGTSSGAAFRHAYSEIALGHLDVCVVLGVERESFIKTPDHLCQFVSRQFERDYQAVFGPSWLAVNGAMVAQRYMHEYEATPEQIAYVAVRNRKHASMNPIAHFTDPITVEDVLNSRMICDPLHLLEAAPRDDGACTIILAAEEKAKKFTDTPIHIRGLGEYNAPSMGVIGNLTSMTHFPGPAEAARIAFDKAKVEPRDIDIAEIYAPFTSLDICALESMGFFDRGKGARAVSEGQTDIGGKLPVNTGGGLTSCGHPVYISGLYNIYESVIQLRGEAGKRQVEGAEIALSSSMHGAADGGCIEILARES